MRNRHLLHRRDKEKKKLILLDAFHSYTYYPLRSARRNRHEQWISATIVYTSLDETVTTTNTGE